MKEIPLGPDVLLRDVIDTIEKSRRRIAVILDDERRVLGTLTDGDVRRCFLSGGGMESPAIVAMNKNPVIAEESISDRDLLSLMRKANILAVPIIDSNGKFSHIKHISDFCDEENSNDSKYVAAVIMAGGEGRRLRPLTNDIPKPMVEVDGVPILERQIISLAKAGIKQCFLAVNHLSQVIEKHFGDGDRFGLSIVYLREKEKMGTAGALNLLPELPEGPFLVMNGDLVTMFDLNSLCDYHLCRGSSLTIAAVKYKVQIPYGVLHTTGQFLDSIEEKPSQNYFCNAGIYVMNHNLINRIPFHRYDMTDLIRACLSDRVPISVFPIHEYWSDIGTMVDLDSTRLFFKSQQQF